MNAAYPHMIGQQSNHRPDNAHRHRKGDRTSSALAQSAPKADMFSTSQQVQMQGGSHDDQDERRCLYESFHVKNPTKPLLDMKGTHSANEQRKEGGIISPPDAVIHPLTVMITTIDAVVALNGRNNH
jgi:hypothetical protein